MIAGDCLDSSSLIPTVFHSSDTGICPICFQSFSLRNSQTCLCSNCSMKAENPSDFFQSFVKEHSGKIQSLERDMRRISSRFGAREKALLHQITSLRDQLQLRTMEFQEKIAEFQSMFPFSPEENTVYTEPSFQSDSEEEPQILKVEVPRQPDGSFGFRLICGNSAEPDCDSGIFIAGIDLDLSPESSAPSEQLFPYDRILKVNGQDIAGATEEEALTALTEAKEPIVVEVLRRMNPWRVSSASSHVTIATQTDPISSEDEEDAVTCPLLPPHKRPSKGDHIGLPATDIADMNRLEMAVEGYIDDTDLEDQCRDQLENLEYEEVTLKRNKSSERIGLTLCYGSGENEETDIFVSEIESSSLADKNGRICAGDQILQINGVDVYTRNQAIELFHKNRQTVTLLLARTPQESGLSDNLSVEDTRTRPTCLSPMPEQVTAEEEDTGALTDATRDSAGSAQEKDSGISRTTDSEPELLPPPIRSPSAESSGTCHSPDPRGMNLLGENISSATMTAEGSPTEATCGSKTSPTTPFGGTSSAMSSPGSEAPPHPANLRLTRSDSEGSLEQELSSLHREMETIRLECDRLIAQHNSAESRVLNQMQQAQSLMATVDNMTKQQLIRQSRKEAALHNPLLQQAYGRVKPVSLSPPPGRSRLVVASTESPLSTPGNRRPVVSQQQLLQQKLGHCPAREDTSSAYNTGGESCRSTPLNMDYMGQSEMDQITGKRDSAVYTLPPPPKHRPPTVPVKKTSLTESQIPRTSKTSVSPAPSQNGSLRFKPGDVMYTNSDNLHDTIVMQQRILRQAMIQQAHQLKKSHKGFGAGPVSSQSLQNALHPEEQTEWKIKRRSDGSRYVAKRPVRNKILKDREQQLTSERCGISTDDDAMSELKIGRYWTREEKKLHLEKSKERKRRQEELIRKKNYSLQKTSDQAIIQLSHKKMMRRKGHQLFDNFTTIQEFLAHGNRSSDNTGALGILSVTTV